jgi:glycosyltransferase involved in cell wall biosynthesis
MFCSTVIPTIGRPTLSRAVKSLLSQTFTADDFEVIVVNDSGKRLAESDWQKSNRVRVISTNRRERSVARNTGAAVAKGYYLHFLDDDDWLVPGALHNLWELAQNTNAGWYYGSSQLIDRQGKPLLQLHHKVNGNCFIQVMAGEWIPLQASLINSGIFFAVGGFNPLVSGPEDIDLLRRIALHSDIAGISAKTACIEWGREGSSTDYDRHAETSRFARESILDAKEVFTRMRSSAKTSYLHGRIVRAYLTSMVWNFKYRRPMTAASRASLGLAGIILAGVSVFSFDFWKAIFSAYNSEAFTRGLEAAGASS